MKDFRELNVWKMGIGLFENVVKDVRLFPKTEVGRIIANQVILNVLPIAANIAAGYGRSLLSEEKRLVKLRSFQNIVVRTDAPEEVIILMNFEGKAIEHVDACLPSVFVPFHLLNPERRVTDVIDKEPYLIIEFFLCSLGKPLVILLKGFGAEDSHFLRSKIKSSMESNDLVCPAAISLSASASAFSQSNSLKYGGRVRAYLIKSLTASSVLVLLADFLYRSISSKMSSVNVIFNARVAILYSFYNKITQYQLLSQFGQIVFRELFYG